MSQSINELALTAIHPSGSGDLPSAMQPGAEKTREFEWLHVNWMMAARAITGCKSRWSCEDFFIDLLKTYHFHVLFWFDLSSEDPRPIFISVWAGQPPVVLAQVVRGQHCSLMLRRPEKYKLNWSYLQTKIGFNSSNMALTATKTIIKIIVPTNQSSDQFAEAAQPQSWPRSRWFAISVAAWRWVRRPDRRT